MIKQERSVIREKMYSNKLLPANVHNEYALCELIVPKLVHLYVHV